MNKVWFEGELSVPVMEGATLKVLHLIPSLGPLRGGPSEAALAMVSALRIQDVEAAILSSNDNGPGLLSLPTGRWIEYQGVPVRLFPRWSPPVRALREFAFTPGLGLWLKDHLHEWDLLHVHSLFSWPTSRGMALARCSGTPYLIHCLGHLQTWSLGQRACRKHLYLSAVERRNLNGAAALQATSASEASDFIRLKLTPPVLDLPLGVNIPVLRSEARSELARQIPSLDAKAPRLLFLSRLHPKKQLEVLIKSLSLLQRRRPRQNWQLLIAGSGEPCYEARLRTLAVELGLAGRCHWLGFVSGDLKDQLLQGSDWFVLPSASENFGIAVAEALAAATPVLLTPAVGIASAVVQAGAGLLSEADPSQLADVLAHALSLDRGPLSKAARQLAVECYSWPATARRMITGYHQILNDAHKRL